MRVTKEKQRKALEVLGSEHARSLIQAMSYALRYLEAEAEDEPMADVEAEEIHEAYRHYIYNCLGIDLRDEPKDEEEARERWFDVWEFHCNEQDGDVPGLD